jgi:cytochrome P450
MAAADDSAPTLPFDPAFWTDPYRFYPLLLAGPPLRLPLLIPAIVVARYREVVEVLADPERFSSRVHELPFIPELDPFGGATTILFSDPPEHTRLRRLVSRYFRGRPAEALAGRIRTTTEVLLERIAARREFDGVRDLAAPLPIAIIAHVLGIPVEDEPMLRTWSEEVFASIRTTLAIAGTLGASDLTAAAAGDGLAPRDATRSVAESIPTSNADAMRALRDYFHGAIARRETHPGDDLMSTLIPAVHGGEMSREELVAMSMFVLFAGGDTTMNLISNGLLALVRQREAFMRLRSAPELIGSAVEEVLRYDSPVQMVLRYPKADTCVGGTDVPGGAAVILLIGAANRDPKVFDDPERFDVTRRPNPHLAFGDGIHACIGAQLARVQGQVALGAVVERFPELALLDPSAPLPYAGSLLSRGLASLPLRPR